MRGDHRGALNRATVVEAALRLLDEVGLDALSVRRLAAELGVKSPALYWHFRNKQELLDEMSEALQLSQDLTGPRSGESWREWLARRARERRRLLLRHRDGARLISGTATGPAVLARFDAELAVLVQAGLSPVQALRSVMAIGHYVTGFVLAEQSEHQAQAPDSMAPGPLAERAPHLAAAIGAGGDPQGEDAFEHGLRMLVSGLAGHGR
ncbi:TetR/AcrR family transcriptional regulator C-terminal domain-containing protein [Actinomadura sp. KC345]|uniref:TetR/AcrR family transcriptional regulator C-terminal domain-containing protein n=1 Tax=Actinomadura sp. KC345 TaxID=2530371 RepID=UPI001FB66A96|nr:TetR/AcrR family transcriptional regulator C-terminal domain-containing protein [Actinomadura sp. KC345]